VMPGRRRPHSVLIISLDRSVPFASQVLLFGDRLRRHMSPVITRSDSRTRREWQLWVIRTSPFWRDGGKVCKRRIADVVKPTMPVVGRAASNGERGAGPRY
jgi:hypothetical protein